VNEPHPDELQHISPNGDGNGDWATRAERQAAARRAYLHSVRNGTPLTGVALGGRFGRSGRWGSQRILEARQNPNLQAHGSPPAQGGLPEPSPTIDRLADSEPTAAPNAPDSASPRIARTTTLAVVTVALVAAIASYDHQRLLAEVAGEDWRAWLLPISVDGLVLTASRTMLTRQRSSRSPGWLAWTAMLAGLTASLAANVAAAQPTLVGRLVAAWPPVALLLAYELLMQQVRAQAPRQRPPHETARPSTPTDASAGRQRHPDNQKQREQGGDAMGMILDDLKDHEGYAARRLPDRTLTSTWTRDTNAFDAYVAACSCGWTGRHDHPPNEHGRTTTEDEWELHHAQPLLATAVPAASENSSTTSTRNSPNSQATAPSPPAPSPTGWPAGPNTSCNSQPQPS
jgi:Protein of unknown function (DUF2637)